MIDIHKLAEQAEIDICEEGDIMGSTNGALARYTDLVLEAAALECDTSADRIAPNGKRTNQVDRHVADVLRRRAESIRAMKGRP